MHKYAQILSIYLFKWTRWLKVLFPFKNCMLLNQRPNIWTHMLARGHGLKLVFSLVRCKMAFLKWTWRPIQWKYWNVLYLILKVLNRPLKWDTVRLWTPTGFKDTGRQSWTFEKNLRFSTKMEVFFERSTLTAGIFESSGSSETYCISF